jgi:hypothetical protein
MSSQQLTMCLWGLACAGAAPHKAFVLLWFLTSMQGMQQATTQVCMHVFGVLSAKPLQLAQLSHAITGHRGVLTDPFPDA